MYFLLLLLASSSAIVAEDRAQFEQFWAEELKRQEKEPIPKEAAWTLYVWAQMQFSLGYCSAYFSADQMAEIQHLPNAEEYMKTEWGRQFITSGSNSFRQGMLFRSEVKPSPEICKKELDGRMAVVRSLTRE